MGHYRADMYERNESGAENHMQPPKGKKMAGRKKRIKIPNENMKVHLVAPKILGDVVYEGYAKFISSPSRDGKCIMSIDVEVALSPLQVIKYLGALKQ